MNLKFWKKKEPKPLTKEEKQSKIIAEGIAGGVGLIFEGIAKGFLIAVLIIVLFFVGLYAHEEYQEYKMCKEEGICFEVWEEIMEVEQAIDCKYPEVDCLIIDIETNDIIGEYNDFCGWQEVRAWMGNKDMLDNIYPGKDIKVDCYEN